MLKLIVCDWNGTLFRDRLEESFFRGLCIEAARCALASKSLRRVSSLIPAFLKAFREYQSAKVRPEKMLGHIGRIVDILNPKVFATLTREQVENYTLGYARKNVSQLDPRMLEPLSKLCCEKKIPIGVISSGCKLGIEKTLELGGYKMDFITANDFKFPPDSDAPGFEFSVTDNKGALLREIAAKQKVSLAEILYIGDALPDEECFKLAGFAAVSFFADTQSRLRFAKSANAKYFKNQKQFEEYLAKIAC